MIKIQFKNIVIKEDWIKIKIVAIFNQNKPQESGNNQYSIAEYDTRFSLLLEVIKCCSRGLEILNT